LYVSSVGGGEGEGEGDGVGEGEGDGVGDGLGDGAAQAVKKSEITNASITTIVKILVFTVNLL
jgi:hypothetical protein